MTPVSGLTEGQFAAAAALMGGRADAVLADAITVCQIPAPPFQEARRGAYVAERLRSVGLAVETDVEGNVLGTLLGRSDLPTTIVMGHLDTVFDEHIDLTVRRERERVYAPGIGDNSLAVAVMWHLAEVVQEVARGSIGSIIFAGTVGEEALGDCRGAKYLWRTHGDRIGRWLALEGALLAEVQISGIACRRLKIAYRGPGGHSWMRAGRPSAIHALGTLIHRLTTMPLPTAPRTTLNVGLIEGGTSVNAIAAKATLLLDLRSEEQGRLEALDRDVRTVVQETAGSLGVEAEIAMIGDQPAGHLPRDHWLARTILQAARVSGVQVSFRSGGTDANIALSHGAPAACIGITQGFGLHTPGEYIEVGPLGSGLGYVVRVLMVLASRPEAPA